MFPILGLISDCFACGRRRRRFVRGQIPSQVRSIEEEAQLDKYLMSQNLELEEWKDNRRKKSTNDYHNLATEPEDSMLHDVLKSKNPYEVLGFGFVSLFQSMRFLSIIFFVMALIMLLCGILNFKSSPANLENLSLFQRLAVTNMN